MLQEQKRAWLNLGIGVFSSIAVLSIVFTKGPDFQELMSWADWDLTLRHINAACLVAAGLWFLGMFITRVQTKSGEVLKDERDILIAQQARTVQVWAVQLLLLFWMVALTETYIDLGAIPIAFPFLIFLSGALVNLMAEAVATLIGYRKLS